MTNEGRLDRVYIFGNKLSFLIPHEWVEQDATDIGTYQYHEAGTDSGWFRVSLITAKPHDENPSERLAHRLSTTEEVIVDEQTGNRVCSSEKDVVESGDRIHIYYWKVINVVASDFVYEAVFSYTVSADRTNDEDTKQMVKLIGQLVSRAQFSAPG